MTWIHQGAQRLSRLMTGLEGLLAQKSLVCLYCGNAHNHREKLPLCKRCWEAIPWILQVECPVCGRYESCPDCARREETWFAQNRSAVRYDEQMKEWLAQYKYRGQEKLSALLGHMLLHAYHLHRNPSIQPNAKTSPVTEVLTFVPLSDQRYAERGFNQAKQMAFELGRLANLPVIPLLRRTRHTDKQSFKARAERLDDLVGVFELDSVNGERLGQASRSRRIRIYIIDDVYTTGSTLNECARTIKSAITAEVCGISWAR